MKHDWNTLEHYLSIHEKVLRFYEKYMVQTKSFKIKRITNNYLELECLGLLLRTYKQNIVRVDISKDVLIEDNNPKRLLAKTFSYSYNANIQKGCNLIRYCSPDDPKSVNKNTPEHHYYHHKHDFTISPPKVIKIENDKHPHFGEFLQEVLERF